MTPFEEATKRARLTQSRILAIEAQHARRAYYAAIDEVLAEYGDGNGRDISGVYREHFPNEIKMDLRRMTRLPAELEERSLVAWTIAWRRAHTWRRMRDEIAETAKAKR